MSRERHPAPRTPWIGPLAGWELLRLARRGQSHRGRLLVVYLLLIAFILTPVFWFENVDPIELFLTTRGPLPPSEAAAFANRFALILLHAILLAVAAMTPGYAAAAIADEKERGTLPLLLTTALSDREIVLGKAVGRLGFVIAAAAAGLPVLAVITLLGGVDPRFLLCGLGLVIGTATLTAAIGVNAACFADDLRGALVRAYGFTALCVGCGFIPPCVLASPFAVLVLIEGVQYGLFPYLLVGIGYPALQVAVAIGFLAAAIPRVRREGAALVAPRPRRSHPQSLSQYGERRHSNPSTFPTRRPRTSYRPTGRGSATTTRSCGRSATLRAGRCGRAKVTRDVSASWPSTGWDCCFW